MSIRNVLVVGGGPAGMAAATALARQGIEVELVEVNRDWRPAGVGLLLQSPPLRALRAMGLADACVTAGFSHPEVRFCDAGGNVRYVVRPPLIPGEDVPAVGIARPVLHAILERALRDAGVTVRLGVSVTEITDTGAATSVRFTDGTHGTYDLVVGADGVHSAVRQLVFPDAPAPVRFGQKIWRALAPRPEPLRHYPIHFGPHGKLGLVPVSEQDLYVYLLQNGAVETPRPDRALLPGLMREQLAGYNELVDEVRDHLVPETVDYRGLHALLLPPPWYRGRVLLVGDAAHTTTPHLAFGVGIAIEDAVVLGELLGTGVPLPEVFARFMERRYERARLIVENSLLLGEWEVNPAAAGDAQAVVGETFKVMAQPI